MSDNINTMIDALIDGDMSGAGEAFQAALNDKITATLDQERISIAGSIFNGTGEEVEEFSDEEVEEELSSDEETQPDFDEPEE